MEAGFDEALQTLVKLQNDSMATVKILQAENDKLRDKVHELEQLLKGSSDRPTKMMRPTNSQTLHQHTAIQRLVASTTVSSPRPNPTSPTTPVIQYDDTTTNLEEEDDEDDEISELGNKKARFRLIAHSGDEREEICPKNREITIPVLVKSYVEFLWEQSPQLVLVMMRPGDDNSIKAFNEIAAFLWAHGVKILVESGSETDCLMPSSEKQVLLTSSHDQLHKYPIDFVITLGGDGTFIRAAYAFPQACPPILAFAFGSLGFLTPFPAQSIQDSLKFVMEGGFGLRLRARLEIELRRKSKETEIFQVLNECVIDRGTTSSLVRLILYSNRDGFQPVTTVQGDGLILATPTGSTAYSLSAGGSMVHPSVPAILVTPICPHSLSFRPILVPDSATLRIQVAPDARNSAWVSIDGRKSIEFKQGDEFILRYSSYPVPAVMTRRTHQGDSDGWLSSLRTALNWNVIQVQKPLNLPPNKENGEEKQ